MKMNNMILIALVALLTVAGGANATTIDSFSEENVVVVDFGHDAPIFAEEAVTVTANTTGRTSVAWDKNMDPDAMRIPQQTATTARGRRLSRLHRERVAKKRSRWASLLPQIIWGKLSDKMRSRVTRQTQRRVKTQLFGIWAQRVILFGGTGLYLLGLGLGSDLSMGSTVCGLAGLGLLAGTVDDTKTYHSLHKGLVASEESVTEWAIKAAQIKDYRSFKQAKFANQVSSTLQKLDARKAKLASARADVIRINKAIEAEGSIGLETPLAEELRVALDEVDDANQSVATLLVELDALLDTSAAVESMSVVKSDTHNVDANIFVTNVNKETCSFEIEFKIPNDYGQSHSTTAENLS